MGKRWFPGHYLMVTDMAARLGMKDSVRNMVRYDPLWAGYYGHYWWHRMELSKDVYDFSIILNDLDKALADGKKMFVLLQNRSFDSSRGAFCPSYIITDYNGTYSYADSGQDFSGCKLWEPAIGDRWLKFQDRALQAIRDHPAAIAVGTEENVQSGAYLQNGWTWQAMNAFILEQSRRGMLESGDLLFHNNMGWSNESSTNYDEQYRMADTMVRTHRAGISPNDLRMSSGKATLSTTYGQFCFDRYVGEAFHMAFVEWNTFAYPENASQLIDFAHDRLRMPFIGWHPVPAGSMPNQTFSITDVIAAVQAKAGKIWSTKPTSVTYFDGVAPPPPSSTVSDTDTRWDWNINPKKLFTEHTAYGGNRTVTNLPPVQFSNAGALPTNDGVNQIFERVADPGGSGEFVYRHQIRADRARGTTYWLDSWRAELGSTQLSPVDGQEYWMAAAIYFDDDMTPELPGVDILELHVPWPANQPVITSPFAMYAGGNLDIVIKYNTVLATTSSQRTDVKVFSEPPVKNVWHHFVFNFKITDDANAFMRIWRKVGDGLTSQIVNYTGRIGYVGEGPYHYPKFGIYAWNPTNTTPAVWPTGAGSSPTRTLHTKGLRVIRASAGAPTISLDTMMAMVVSGGTAPPPPVSGEGRLPLPSRANWFPKLTNGESSWSPRTPTVTDTSIVRRPRRSRLR